MEAEQTKEIITKESETEKTGTENFGAGQLEGVESGKGEAKDLNPVAREEIGGEQTDADKTHSPISSEENKNITDMKMKETVQKPEEAEQRQGEAKEKPGAEAGEAEDNTEKPESKSKWAEENTEKPESKSKEAKEKLKEARQESKEAEENIEESESKSKETEEKLKEARQESKGAKEKPEEAEQGTKETKQKAKQKKTKKAKEAKVKTKNIRQEGEVSKVNSESGLTEKQATKIQNVLNEESAGEESEWMEETGGKKRRTGKPALILLLTAVCLLAAVYGGITFFYRTHFFPNTSINGVVCGNLDAASVVRLIDAQILDYSLAVTGRDHATGESGALLGTIRAEDIGLTYADTAGGVGDVLKEQNPFTWPMVYLGKKQESYSLVQGVAFSEEKLKETVEAWEACQEKNMTPPKNAYIGSYSDATNGYEIVYEEPGTELDLEKAIQCVADKLNTHEITVDLEEMLCYTEANVRGTDKKLTDAVEKANTWLSTRVLYDWNGNEVLLDGEILRDWITIEEGEPRLDEEAVAGFVKKQAKEFDTYGKRKKFTTSLGIELSLKSPNYGWKTDVEAETQELLQLIYQGSDVKKEPNYSAKGQDKGVNDIGDSYIEADLTHQHLYVYQDGAVVLETDFVSGKMNSTPGCVTPEGIFGLSYKTTNAVLRGADYETPVNYWMPFFGNYGMHDATWRVNFGGTIYIEHGSHGCINLPLSAASQIYEYVFKGSPVVCYYYEVDPLSVPVEGPALTEEELLSQEEPTLSGSAEQDQGQPQDQVQP